MADERRRPLRDEELARIARAVDPRARATYSAPMLGGVDAATYAVDLDVVGERRELVVRIHTLPEERDGEAARRYWKAISGIPVTAPVLLPRGVHLDAEGSLVGLPCLVMTRLSGTPLARPANEESWIDQLAAALASIHGVDVSGLPPDYRRGVTPADLVEASLARSAPRHLGDLWDEVAKALRSAPNPTPNGVVLTHHDFWFGNTLWSEERLTGIVDWDGARIDDPAFDVAYARGDMQFCLGGDAPDQLLARYEARRGPLRAMPFWDLVAMLPAFRWLSDWVEGYREVGTDELTDDLARERLALFVRAALGAL
ncbi:MAG: phosphotransferase family protein [Candidatus Limnocylindria bacterium]